MKHTFSWEGRAGRTLKAKSSNFVNIHGITQRHVELLAFYA